MNGKQAKRLRAAARETCAPGTPKDGYIPTKGGQIILNPFTQRRAYKDTKKAYKASDFKLKKDYPF